MNKDCQNKRRCIGRTIVIENVDLMSDAEEAALRRTLKAQNIEFRTLERQHREAP